MQEKYEVTFTFIKKEATKTGFKYDLEVDGKGCSKILQQILIAELGLEFLLDLSPLKNVKEVLKEKSRDEWLTLAFKEEENK